MTPLDCPVSDNNNMFVLDDNLEVGSSRTLRVQVVEHFSSYYLPSRIPRFLQRN